MGGNNSRVDVGNSFMQRQHHVGAQRNGIFGENDNHVNSYPSETRETYNTRHRHRHYVSRVLHRIHCLPWSVCVAACAVHSTRNNNLPRMKWFREYFVRQSDVMALVFTVYGHKHNFISPENGCDGR